MTATPTRPDQLSEQRRALLAKRLRGAAPSTPAARSPITPAQDPPPSFAQERLWFVEQLNPGTTAYVMRAAVRLRGRLDLDALRGALADLGERHDSLRMSFPESDDGRCRVHVADRVDIPLRFVPPDPAGGPDVLGWARALTTADSGPFDLAQAPLMRAMVVRIGPDDHVLHLAMHHIISDGWSRPVLLGDWAQLYAARIGQSPPPPATPVRYGDYAAWQRERLSGAAADRDLAYWQQALAGIAALELPTDRPRPAQQRSDGAGYKIRFDDALVEKLRLLGREHGATLYMVLLAGLHTLLSRVTGQRDFAVGSPVAGRLRPELEPVAGLFVNMLALRARITDTTTFRDLLAQTRDRVLEALNHQELPFERLVQELNLDRDTSRPPVFQVLFSMHNSEGAAGAWPEGLTSLRFGLQITDSKHDLSVYVDERTDGMYAVIGYRTDLFDTATVARLGELYQRLLADAVARPDTLTADLDLMDTAQRTAVLALGTGTGTGTVPVPAGTLADVIGPHVAAAPGAPAIVSGADVLSYRDLDARANQLAHWLRAAGVTRGSLVGVCLEQSTELAIALLGVLRAGAAYVPLDADQPGGRVRAMLDDARPALVLTDGDLEAGTARVVRLGDALPGIRGHRTEAPEPWHGPDDLAYVIYTSGSTGRPKGVAVAHRQVVNYLAGVSARFEVAPGARWALLQSLSFDFAVTVFYLGLASGGCVHLVGRRSGGDELAAYLREHRVDYLKMTPSHLAALAAGGVRASDLVPARALILGGEASRLEWAGELARGGAAVFNHYGPTEATVGITTYRVPPDGQGPTPIGQPLPQARVYVLDERLRPVPVGVPGEIHLGGDRLARGYLNRPGLTAQRFLPDPYAAEPGSRMYATGDLGRWRADGQLEFLGRRDGQVKLRGYRVELGEVEAALAACPGVAAAVAVLADDRLVGYLQRDHEQPGPDPEPADLRRALAETLPEYMIPNLFMWLDRLPLQEHGKVDRRALPAPTAAAVTAYSAPQGPVETVIAEVWAAVLGVEQVGATDDFFDLGGHSLLATQVVARLRRAVDLPRPISVMDLFQARTVRELALLGTEGTRDGRLLHELSRRPSGARLRSYVCVPYGGASAVVFQPLADALPDGHSLYAVAVPGHDIGLAEQIEPITVTAARCVEEILATVTGPLVVYGHCGPGGALAVEIARLLEAAGRELDAVYLGGIFPFARPVGGMLGRMSQLRLRERLRGDRVYANWLQGMGADLGAFDEEQRRFLIRAMRHDAQAAEDYFTDLLHRRVDALRAPIISVVGERDPGTEYYQERYREWGFLSGSTALVVIEEAGHYFAKFRAAELAAILTDVDARLDEPVAPADPRASWNLVAASGPAEAGAAPAGRPPRLRRFFAVAFGQVVSATGSALTGFAVPLWTYLETGSLIRFALFAVLSQIPGILVAPLAGALIDRSDRRRAMLAGDLAAFGAIAAFAGLYWSDNLAAWHVYTFVAWLSVALTFQRLAYLSAVPQLVPKRYLGHANGMVQLGGGIAQFLVPLIAVGLIATVGLGGILLIDLVSYLFVIVVLTLVRFPQAMARVRRESMLAEITAGLRYTVRHRGFRAMVLFFAVFNLFLAPLYLLLSPLVLAFAPLESVARVSLAGGAGAVLGGLVMMIWGGPRHRRMRGMLLTAFGFAAAGMLTGLRPSVALIAAGAVGMSLSLSVINGIWLTIIQTKVPQRLHARVIALNMIIALSTMPLGQAVLAPLLVPRAEALLRAGGPLADTVGALLGTGPGRGIGLLYAVLGCCIALTVAVSLRVRTLARFDDEVPDAQPDDVVGLQQLAARDLSAPATQGVPHGH